jgi:hypothetical protein
VSKQVGSGLGGVLSRLLGETLIHAHGSVVHQTQEARINANTQFMEHIESGLAPILDGFFGRWLEDDGIPEELKTLIRPMTEPGHQFDVLLQIMGVLSAMISGIFGLGAPYLQPFLNTLWGENRTIPLSAELAADGVERGRWPQAYGDQWAAMTGIQEAAFNDMVNLVGEPPGIESMLSLFRRGLLGEGDFDEMVAFSRILTRWTPFVKLLAYSTMTPGDALEARLKGVLDDGTARELFKQGGGLDTQFDVLLSTTGNPIGVEASLNLLNHGLISEADAQQVILHSRVNPQFEPMALLLRHKWLGVIQIEIGLKAGTITPAQGTLWLTEDGYPADQVAAFVAGATAGKLVAQKALTEAQIASAYETGIVSQAAADASLQALGYSEGEVEIILALYEHKRELGMATAAVAQVKKVYLAKRIDDAQATTDLAGLGIDADAITQYLAVWKVEQVAELKELTAAQIGSFYKKGLLTEADAVSRWTEMGYTAADAALLDANYGGPAPPGSPAATGVAAGA